MIYVSTFLFDNNKYKLEKKSSKINKKKKEKRKTSFALLLCAACKRM
jgi:hypothetical protein